MATKTKKYVVADGYSFTAAGHIYVPGESISESVFADKNYFAKIVSQKKIVAVGDSTESVKTAEATVEETADAKATSEEKTSSKKDK